MKKVEYEVKNLDCAGCAGKIQHKAGTMAGVLNANLDLYKKRFTLETDENYEEELFLHEINFFADSIEPGTQILKMEEYDEEESKEDDTLDDLEIVEEGEEGVAE